MAAVVCGRLCFFPSYLRAASEVVQLYVYYVYVSKIYIFFKYNLGKKKKENQMCASVKWIYSLPPSIV